MVQLAAENDIRLFIYLDPIYEGRYKRVDVLDWLEFKRRLAEVTPYLDFSNFKPIFGDPQYFVDTLHYEEALGDLMLKEINQALAGDVDNFELGQWMTPESVDGYIHQQEVSYFSLQ